MRRKRMTVGPSTVERRQLSGRGHLRSGGQPPLRLPSALYLVAAGMLFAVAWGLSVSSLTLLGVRSSRASRIPLIITLVWVGAFFAFAWSTFPSSAAEARRDRVAPRAVPVYPGATFSKEEIWGESDDDTVGKGFLNPPY